MNISISECLCVLGPRGCGKTTVLRHLVAAAPRTQGVILFDVQGEYGDLCSVQVDGAVELAEKWREILVPGARVQFLPGKGEPASDELIKLARIVRTLRRYTLVLEEADSYLSVHRDKELAPVQEIINLGRHTATSILAVGRRAPNIDKTLMQNSRIFATYTDDPDDQKDLDHRAGRALPWEELRVNEFFLIGQGYPPVYLWIDREAGRGRFAPVGKIIPRKDLTGAPAVV